MNTRSRAAGSVVIAALFLAVGCKGKESSSSGMAGASSGPVSAYGNTSGASAATVPGAGNSTAATTAGGTLTDPNIVFILDQANAADSARGKLAETKGTSADVRNFGKMMAGEHHALRAQGQELAKKLGVTPAAPAGDQSTMQAQQEMDSLNAMPKGKAWDKAYIDYEVNYHDQVLQTATKALGAAQNQQLKDLIKKAAPIIQHHLDRAKEIHKKLGA